MGTTKSTLKAKRPKRVDRRKTTSTRITPELRAKLDAAAEQSERSLAQEVEFRLERTFMTDEGRYLEFGDADTFQFCRLLAQMADMMTATNGKRWKDHPGWFMYVVGAWTEIVKRRAGMGPDPELSPGLELFGKLVRPNFDKSMEEELRNRGAKNLAAVEMLINEFEEK
jgi:hypothetical protein